MPSADLESFIGRWTAGDGGQERANYALFLSEVCDVLDVPRPDQASHDTGEMPTPVSVLLPFTSLMAQPGWEG
jgi:hypothetical protein